MKFKKFFVIVNGREMAAAIMTHAERIGYSFTNAFADDPVRVVFYSNGLYSIVDASVNCDFEQCQWFDFFKLTPEDVRVEPERFKSCFSYCHPDLSLGYENVSYMVTKDQIERIKAIMEEGQS